MTLRDVFDDNKQVSTVIMYATPEEVRELFKNSTTDQLREFDVRLKRFSEDELRDKALIIGTAHVARAERLSSALTIEIRRRGNKG